MPEAYSAHQEIPTTQESAESEKPPISPNIKYDERLLSPENPYSVQIDADMLGELFRTQGLSDEQIAELNITVKPQATLLGEQLGTYNYRENEAVIYTDWAYEKAKKRENLLTTAYQTIQKSPEKIRKVRTRMFRRFLPKVHEMPTSPEEISKLAYNTTQTEINEVLLHQSKHLADLQHPNLAKRVGMFLASRAIYSAAFGVTTGFAMKVLAPTGIGMICAPLAGRTVAKDIASRFDPLEIRANNFAKANNQSERFGNIITISPKLPNGSAQAA